MPHDDTHDLERFVHAQDGVYQYALAEVAGGLKRSHWMWYVFPQLAGLGTSPTAKRFAIASLAEAEAYLLHPVLGPRLVGISEALLAETGRSAREIFGATDEMKLRSSATLFARVSARGSVFERLLDQYFGGTPDERTIALLEARNDRGE